MLIGVFRLIDDVQLLEILKKTCAETHTGMRERVRSPPTKNEHPSTRPTLEGPKTTAMKVPRKLYRAAR